MISGLRTRVRALGRRARGRGAARRPTRRGLLIVATSLVVAVAAVLGLSALRVDTQPQAFLPSADPSLLGLESAARAFGGDPIVVLAESPQPGTLLGPGELPRVLKLEGQLAGLPDVAVVYGPGTVLNSIAISSGDLLNRLFAQRDEARQEAEQQARDQGAGAATVTAAGDTAVARFDDRYAPLLVQGLPMGLPTLRNPAFVQNLVFDGDPAQGAAPRPQWRFVVPSADAISILVRPREHLDQESTDRLVAAVRATSEKAGLATRALTITGAPAVAASLAGQVRREIPLLGGCAVALIAFCYLTVPWLGRRRHRLLPIAATLAGTGLTLAVFGWLGRPLSLGAMAFLPILIGIGSDFPAYLVQRGGRRRVLVAALASAAGFASLGFSPLPFVRDLGLALALGVLLAVGLAMLLTKVTAPEVEDTLSSGWRPPRLGGRWVRLSVAVVAVAVATFGWAVLPRLNLEADPDRLAAGMPAVLDAQHAERVLGSSGEVRVVLSGPSVLTPDALDWMRRAEDGIVLRHGDQLRPVLSLPDLLRFLGPSPSAEQISAATELLPDYLIGAVTTPDYKQAVLSLGIRLQDLGSQGRLLDSVREELPPLPAGFQVSVSGLPVVAARGYDLISGHRYQSNGVGILVAGLALLIGLRRRSDAVRAVMAATLATGWGLAVVSALSLALSPLTVALGCLTTATACEFTVLLADAFRRRRRRQWRTVGVAALAAALGYATLAISSIDVIRDFGLLLSITVLLSLVAAHLVLLLAPDRSEDAIQRPAVRRVEAVVA